MSIKQFSNNLFLDEVCKKKVEELEGQLQKGEEQGKGVGQEWSRSFQANVGSMLL